MQNPRETFYEHMRAFAIYFLFTTYTRDASPWSYLFLPLCNFHLPLCFVPHAVCVNEPSWFPLLCTQIFCYLFDFVLMNLESSICSFCCIFWESSVIKKVPAFQTCCKNFCKFWLPRSLLFPSRCVQARGQGPHQGTNDAFVRHEYNTRLHNAAPPRWKVQARKKMEWKKLRISRGRPPSSGNDS